MNIKFKMPKFGRNLTGEGVVKELLLTTLATTISIVLTFGTAHYLEQRQEKQARRLMAMTVINDIAESIETVKKLQKAEEEGINITLFLMENVDRLENFSDDTLETFFDYVIPVSLTSDLEFKKTNESIFNSSQETWRTLDDKKFLNNVQDFYNARAVLERQLKDEIVFQRPVTREELNQMTMYSEEVFDRKAYVAVCRKLLTSTRVKRYTDFSSNRINAYIEFLNYYVNQNEENKFLMNITEQDMKDFLNRTYMTVRRAGDNDLLGAWEAVLPNDNYQVTIEYFKDHTFKANYIDKWTHSALAGKMIQRYSISGTWSVEGDSLMKVFDPKSFEMEIDENGVVCRPDNASAFEQMKKEMSEKPNLITYLERRNNRVSQATNLDKSGTRMQLTEANQLPTHYRKKTELK